MEWRSNPLDHQSILHKAVGRYCCIHHLLQASHCVYPQPARVQDTVHRQSRRHKKNPDSSGCHLFAQATGFSRIPQVPLDLFHLLGWCFGNYSKCDWWVAQRKSLHLHRKEIKEIIKEINRYRYYPSELTWKKSTYANKIQAPSRSIYNFHAPVTIVQSLETDE